MFLPRAPRLSEESFNLIRLTIVAAIVGMLTGLIAGYFRIFLHMAEHLREFVISKFSLNPWIGLPAFVIICMVATGIAALLVTKIEPHAEGSGIPHVEAVVEGKATPGRTRILPVKFIGGLLAIGSGLMLGREGPLVQMGGAIATTVNKYVKVSSQDVRVIIGAGAAAGLATAFNAPIAGGVFILEELVKRFEVRTTLATLTASSAGFITSTLIVGPENVLRMGPLPQPSFTSVHWVLILGIICGVIGVAYSWLVMFFLAFFDWFKIPAWMRASAIGMLIALVGWFGPSLVGGGDVLTQEFLWAHGTFWVVLGIFVLRFFLGPLCYAAGTPGGLFAPMLVIGTGIGLLVGQVAHYIQPTLDMPLPAFSLIGMAAFFTATVRAPVTGVILATEMTGSALMLPPMLGACAMAMLIATAAHSEPIYDQLTRRSERTAEIVRVMSALRHRFD